MWLRVALVLSFSVLLTSCTTDPISSSAAKPVYGENRLLYGIEGGDTVAVTIVRDQGLLGSGCATKVLVNDQVAAYVRAGEKVTLHIPPGEITLGADGNTGGLCVGTLLAQVEANLQIGKPRSYRIGLNWNGEIGIYRTVEH